MAKELEDELRGELIALPGADFASETRIARLADFLAETEDGRTALHDLADDDQAMLSLLVGSVGETRSQAMGAAAMRVTKVLHWDHLASYFGEETLVRRTVELLTAATDTGLAIPNAEREALELAAEYAAGNRPETAIDRIMRIQEGDVPSRTAGSGAVDEKGSEAIDADERAPDTH